MPKAKSTTRDHSSNVNALPAYVIVQKLNGRVYTYMETEEHYKNAEQHRVADGGFRLDTSLLGFECDLRAYGDNVYFVFPLRQ